MDTEIVYIHENPAGPPRDPSTPRLPLYLTSGYPSSVKGGTVIAGDVWDRDEHQRRLADLESYGPACPKCGRPMQGHGLRERRPVREVPIDIQRYRCRPCHAVVQVLPAFVARHLWRTWETVEAVVVPPEQRPPVVVPKRTRRRWRARASQPVRVVLHVLSSLRTAILSGLVAALGLDATRRALLAAFRPLAGAMGACAALSVLLGKVLPGLRVM